MSADEKKIVRLAAAMRKAKRTVALTGAGVSAASGIPTFREARTGLWSRYDPAELATPEAFARNPSLVWRWYKWRRQLIRNAKPNGAHVALARMQEKFRGFTLVTQNVDGLHQLAGSRHVVELHGNIHRTKCSIENRKVTEFDVESETPICPQCGNLLRPDVVWFGESLPSLAISEAIRASRKCDLFLSIGTSAIVQPAASLAIEAVRHGAIVAEINLEPTELTTFVDIDIQQSAAECLPILLQRAFQYEAKPLEDSQDQ